MNRSSKIFCGLGLFCTTAAFLICLEMFLSTLPKNGLSDVLSPGQIKAQAESVHRWWVGMECLVGAIYSTGVILFVTGIVRHFGAKKIRGVFAK